MKYSNTHKQASFLLGGIGTGNISLGSRGQFHSFELFNKPGKNNLIPFTFALIRISEKGKPPIIKVIEAKYQPPYSNSHGLDGNHGHQGAGLPRLQKSTIEGKVSICEVLFYDDTIPVSIKLIANSPFIPLDEKNSGLPVVKLQYEVTNTSSKVLDVTICFSTSNVTGEGIDQLDWKENCNNNEKVNRYISKNELQGINFQTVGISKRDINYGDMSLLTPDSDVSYKLKWLNQGFYDGLTELLHDLENNDKLTIEPIYHDDLKSPHKTPLETASLCIHKTIEPNKIKTFTFYYSWYFPNRYLSWDSSHNQFTHGEQGGVIKNFYATFLDNSIHVSTYFHEKSDYLINTTTQFEKALYQTTLPQDVLDSIAYNLTILRSTTCFVIDDGTFMAYEGCHEQEGCCFGSCTHVWNYEQSLAFLFPKLERSMREVEFLSETDESGNMAFRSLQKLGMSRWQYHPAVDGQMGTIIQLYRDILLSGDVKLLNKVWDKVKASLNFALSYWDSDNDYVLDSQQHNTYDIEFYGPNSLANSMFFGAIKASLKMAKIMNDNEHIDKFTIIYEKGSKKADELLFNGEYYQQNIDDVNSIRHQYGTGCLSDQLFGQTLAHISGLGYVLDKQHTKKAIYSVYKNNFKKILHNHINAQRSYALNDEGGLLVCSWPNGNKPVLEFPYANEVWAGIEYQVATHLLYEGFEEQAYTIIKAIRKRHDGINRNPWNEVECGNHYARSLASFGLLIAASGYEFNLIENEISFSPNVKNEEFTTFFICDKGWGIYSHKEKTIKTIYGNLEDIQLKGTI